MRPSARTGMARTLPMLLGVSLAATLMSVPVAAATAAGSSPKGTQAPGGTQNVPFRDIATSGPLTHVVLGNELSCQVAHSGDSAFEFYPPTAAPGDCGTFLATGGQLYAPSFSQHTGTATGSLGQYTPFTPVSQSAVSGSGTLADPYRVVTSAAAAQTGLLITQTDSYVVGAESYQTSVLIENLGQTQRSMVLYRAGDCFLAGSDSGVGIVDPGQGSIGCLDAVTGRIEEWVPLTGGSHYLETFYSNVWSAIASQQPFPDVCECATQQDNGGGVSWSVTLNPDEGATFAHITTFSPAGNEALVASKTADDPSTPPGGQNGYTISIANPNDVPVTLSSIIDELPAGFDYVPGSTTGATTNDPSVSGTTLTWNGQFVVSAGGDVSLHFRVVVGTEPGTFFNQATGVADGYDVAPTGPTAPITVTSQGASADVSVTQTDAPDPVSSGQDVAYQLVVANGGPQVATGVVATDTLPPQTTFVSANTTQGTCSQSSGVVTCDLGSVAAGGTATVTIVAATPTVTENTAITNVASVSALEPDPDPSDNSSTENTLVAAPRQDATSGYVDQGGSVNTGRKADPDNPQVTQVTLPSDLSGPVAIREEEGSPTDCSVGYTCFGQRVRVRSPSAVHHPIHLYFRTDPTVIPPGTPISAVQIFKDGRLVPSCAITPTCPCVKNRSVLADGDYLIVVLTQDTSGWRQGK
jgi:uncharacterized repeat protein (TIGR01451 family)